MNCWKASLLASPQHSPVAPTTTQPQPWRRDWKSRPLRRAARAGVEVLALECCVEPGLLAVKGEIPVCLRG